MYITHTHIYICTHIYNTHTQRRWGRYLEVLREAKNWPAASDCGDTFKNGLKADDWYEMPVKDIKPLHFLLMVTTHLNELFLVLDPDVARRKQNMTRLRREEQSKFLRDEIARQVRMQVPADMGTAGRENPDDDDCDDEDPAALRDEFLERNKPTYSMPIHSMHAAVETTCAVEEGETVDAHALQLQLARHLEVTEILHYQSMHALWLVQCLTSGMVEGGGMPSGIPGQKGGKQLKPDPSWVGNLPSQIRKLKDQKIVIGPHFNADGPDQKAHRKARNLLFDTFRRAWQERGSFGKLLEVEKVAAVVAFGQKPLFWSWSQTVTRLTDHIAYIRSPPYPRLPARFDHFVPMSSHIIACIRSL
jgi:hypothetical protein